MFIFAWIIDHKSLSRSVVCPVRWSGAEMMTWVVSDCQALLSPSCRSNPPWLYNYMFLTTLRFKHTRTRATAPDWVRAGARLQRQINHQSWPPAPLKQADHFTVTSEDSGILFICCKWSASSDKSDESTSPVSCNPALSFTASVWVWVKNSCRTVWLNHIKLWRAPSCDWGNIMILQNNVQFLATF